MTAKRFWDKFSKESILTLYTPFVVSLASGNLKLDTFEHYIAQDVHFLKCFAQAYELAEDCADDDDAKVSIVELRNLVLKQLKHHDSFLQEWGLDLSKETTPNPATTKYTNFVLATASGKVEGVKGPGELATPFEKTKVAAYTLGAMAPSMRLNVFLGKELMDVNGDEHPYKKWIDKYSSEAYQIAIVTAPKSDQSQPESQSQIARMSSADLRNTWEVLSREYTEEYEQCTESMLANQKGAIFCFEEFDYEGLKTALEQLSEFERRANMRVIESNVLPGLNLEDIKRAGERLILHDGCQGFFQSITNNQNLNVNVHVLSYCWCADLIRSAFSSGGIHTMHVHANEFEFENSLSTGEIIKKVETPTDKLQAFSDILKSSDQSDKTNLTVYIGDSVGDLLCLLEADIGIVIGSSSSLRRIASHFGVSFVPLFPALIKKQKEHVEGSDFSWKALSGVLYTVSSWAEVHSFIIGC
ncbi:hypothetical protein L1987_39585 [Smallanthus sonchifolius]|uniref:Uncharacterized protein n=1 Tax=Smallanthus sonchifolius TaxID=185202 RepID=A0ACB9HLS0_9ASTR|nr:hypothetical protein L1987_39585 [Smallanthus sonchifolius]